MIWRHDDIDMMILNAIVLWSISKSVHRLVLDSPDEEAARRWMGLVKVVSYRRGSLMKVDGRSSTGRPGLLHSRRGSRSQSRRGARRGGAHDHAQAAGPLPLSLTPSPLHAFALASHAAGPHAAALPLGADGLRPAQLARGGPVGAARAAAAHGGCAPGRFLQPRRRGLRAANAREPRRRARQPTGRPRRPWDPSTRRGSPCDAATPAWHVGSISPRGYRSSPGRRGRR